MYVFNIHKYTINVYHQYLVELYVKWTVDTIFFVKFINFIELCRSWFHHFKNFVEWYIRISNVSVTAYYYWIPAILIPKCLHPTFLLLLHEFYVPFSPHEHVLLKHNVKNKR